MKEQRSKAKPSRKSSYFMGIKGKLYVAIGVIVALTISMGGISWHLFHTSSYMIGSITKETVPAMLAAAKISTTTAQLNEEIPNIASVEDVKSLKKTHLALKEFIKKQEQLIEEIQTVEHDQRLSKKVLEKTNEIDNSLEKIYLSQMQVLENEAQLKQQVALLVESLNAFEHEVTILVDNAFFNLIIDMEQTQNNVAGDAKRSLQKNAETLTTLLEVKADGNLLAGLLGITSQHDSIERLPPIRERFVATTDRLKRHLAILVETSGEVYQNLNKLVLQMIALGNSQSDIFDLRVMILNQQNQFDKIYAEIKQIARTIDRAEEALVADILQRVEVSTADANKQLATGRLIMIYGAVISVVFSFLIGWLYIGQNIIRRMTQLGGSMLSIAKGEFSQHIPAEGNDEITEMADAVKVFKHNMMENQQLTKELQVAIEKAETAKEQIELMNVELEHRVEDRTKELKEANSHLQTTLHDLQIIQEELVEAEKMASLGRLVAGISHEINTPVGNAVTAASTLRERMQNLHQQHQGGDLSKRKFEDFIHSGQKISELILDNLKRAANLVTTFKQISVDEASLDEQKSFNVKENLNRVIKEVNAIFRANHQFTVDLQCADDLVVVSHPQALLDVMQSLMSDSLIHGFKNKSDGTISMVCTADKETLTIDYRDDGCGMDEETVAQIFDPFFTTSRGHGGSGLGMHIVYNVISQKLKGKIKCQSAPGEGAQFLIQIPITQA